jgi:hypothetical protein
MHCNICSEKNPCPDCVKIMSKYPKLYATQGGGIAIPQDGHFVFIDPPEWSNFEVYDVVPKDWDLIDVSLT